MRGWDMVVEEIVYAGFVIVLRHKVIIIRISVGVLVVILTEMGLIIIAGVIVIIGHWRDFKPQDFWPMLVVSERKFSSQQKCR